MISLLPRVEACKNEVVVCPPFTSLCVASDLAQGFSLSIGAQNVCEFEDGACTGEIGVKMLSDIGVSHIIIGHSERRKNFQESDKKINKKVKLALKSRFKIILCVGESRAERMSGKTALVLKKQIEEATNGLYENELANIVFAYEPVWAIGSGEAATEKQICESVHILRQTIADLYSQTASKNVKIVYGGSVTEENCKKICNCAGVDGLLVGGASLCAEKFAKICKC